MGSNAESHSGNSWCIRKRPTTVPATQTFSAKRPILGAAVVLIVFGLLVGCGTEMEDESRTTSRPDPTEAPATSTTSGTSAPSTTSETSATSSTSEGSATTGTSAETSAEAHIAVAFQDVRYGCGPTDGAGIGFGAVGYSDHRGRVDLVVGDEVFGTTGVLTLGTELELFWMDIALTQEAFDIGAGELRFVEQGTDEVLGTEPVILRMPDDVMCG